MPGPDIPPLTASSPPTVVRVALPVPLPRLFDYLPADDHPTAIGARVRVPFGTRERIGVVAEVGRRPPDVPELRRIIGTLDPAPLLAGELFASLSWLARYTHAPLGEIFAAALPASLRRGDDLPETGRWGWRLTEAGATVHASLRGGTRPRAVADLLAAGACGEETLGEAVEGWRAAARSLAGRGLVERLRLKDAGAGLAPIAGPLANPEQATAIAAIAHSHDRFAPMLLDGVTGSGKTEVYLQAIADCLARGRQALVLVPEIGLTPQMLARFRARLGVTVHALHSDLNDNERARVWTAAWRGEARVIVGTRSAVFTPLPEAGLIVVDEEHDGSYKQQDGVRYHARDFALVRAKALAIPVVLGSATPSLESLHNAMLGRYQHLRLRQRAGVAQPPSVRVVDVRKRPLQAGLSQALVDAMRGALDAGGQVLVFKNRRGYAPVLLCHDCGWSAQCTRCSTPTNATAMTVHAGGRRLQCHHCGARRPVPLACPDCGALALQPQGNGTERIEEFLTAHFADVPVLRVDRGSTRRRDGLADLLGTFGSQPGILVGTQMLAKGHDLPNLSLVAVVGIDEGLFSADFRAHEKVAQMLVQVAGRAGRAARAGEVWLQTHHPDHPLLQTLIEGGYHAFVEQELLQREAACFPPFAHLALLRAEAASADAPAAFLHAARTLLDEARAGDGSALDLHGPLPAPMPRRAGMQRMHLLLSSADRRSLHAALDAAVPVLYGLPEARRVRWSLDVDPVDLY